MTITPREIPEGGEGGPGEEKKERLPMADWPELQGLLALVPVVWRERAAELIVAIVKRDREGT